MIYVLTVHFQSPKWIEVQATYLQRHTSEPYQVFAILNDIDARYERFFDDVSREEGTHAQKLNSLALKVSKQARDEDLLVFLDGDAFPITDYVPVVRDMLTRTPLVAVRRAENNGDVQPHPSFCVTTVGFWNSLPGDWRLGRRWINSDGVEVTDVGGNLWGMLVDRDIPWTPLVRSNRRDLHALWFGVYGGLVYHHGAGFRKRWSRHDRDELLRAQPGLADDEAERKRQRQSVAAAGEKVSEQVFARLAEPDFLLRYFHEGDPALSL